MEFATLYSYTHNLFFFVEKQGSDWTSLEFQTFDQFRGDEFRGDEFRGDAARKGSFRSSHRMIGASAADGNTGGGSLDIAMASRAAMKSRIVATVVKMTASQDEIAIVVTAPQAPRPMFRK